MRILNYLKTNKPLSLGIILILLTVLYSIYIEYNLKNYGIITIARVERLEGAEQGGNLHILIFFGGQQYPAIVNSLCSSCKGNFFYVRVLKYDPTSNVRLYEDKPVPKCILSKLLPREGWEAIPKDTCQ